MLGDGRLTQPCTCLRVICAGGLVVRGVAQAAWFRLVSDAALPRLCRFSPSASAAPTCSVSTTVGFLHSLDRKYNDAKGKLLRHCSALMDADRTRMQAASMRGVV
jgi:hypothetical protein